MKRLIVSTIIAFSLFVLLVQPLFSAGLESPYIRKGACPFEGCSYGEWTVVTETAVYSQPNKTSAIVGSLPAGDKVLASTGEIHVEPGEAKVIDADNTYASKFSPEEIIYILDYSCL